MSTDGHETLLSIRVAGDLVGEYSALNDRPRSATVTACKPCRLNIIQRTDLQRFLVAYPDAAIALAGMVADRLRSANEYRIDFTSYPVPVRLARVLTKIATCYGQATPTGLVIDVQLTQTELASLCGAAEVTIQKVLRAFRRESLIHTGYRHITVTDLLGLQTAAKLAAFTASACPEPDHGYRKAPD